MKKELEMLFEKKNWENEILKRKILNSFESIKKKCFQKEEYFAFEKKNVFEKTNVFKEMLLAFQEKDFRWVLPSHQ